MKKQMAFPFYEGERKERVLVGLRVDGVDYPIGGVADIGGGIKMQIIEVDYIISRGNKRKRDAE